MEMENQKLDDKASKAMSGLVLLEEDTTSANISAEQGNHVQDLLDVDVWSQSVDVWSMGVAIWEFQEAKEMRPQKVAAAAKSYSQMEESTLHTITPEEVFGDMRQQKAAAKLSKRSIMKENNKRLKWQKKNAPFTHR
jgi:hypothetical protein